MNTRQNKIAKQIQKDIADIIQMHAREFITGKMLTVTAVRISPDLSIARIYISVFPSENSGDIIAELNGSSEGNSPGPVSSGLLCFS